MKAGSLVDGRFELGQSAGSGAMGVVYRAKDVITGEVVALKVLRPQLSDLEERFTREAEVLRDLLHPSIVAYIAHGKTSDGDSYLAMEWLEGETLTARLKRGVLTIAEAIALVGRVADALFAAHQRGIVHRDVKPGNLFLEGNDLARVRLLDFGIARLCDANRELTMSGVMLGTPGYMAPEQARGSRNVDARADVFALGCLFFRCLTGRTPFVADEAMSVLLKVVLEEAPRLASIRGDVPPALDALVARLLEKKPDDRPADGGAVAKALQALGPTKGAAPITSINAPMLTGTERRVTCLVLASPRRLADDDATLQAESTGPKREAALREAVAPHQGELFVLADGSFMVPLSSAAAATDLAARAARCALSMRRVLGAAPMAIVTGRAESEAALAMGELIERGVRTLRHDAAVAVRLDEVTAGLLGQRFDVSGDAAGLLLMGERDQTEAGRTLLGKRTPCVGRDREINVLAGVLAQCESEPLAQVALVTGVAGVGKSRLRAELVARTRARGAPIEVWIGRADPMGAGAPLSMIGEAIRRAAGVVPGEALVVSQQKLRARIATNVPEADRARVTEFMGEIAGVPFPDEDSVQLRAARQSPMLRSDQMRRAWEDTLAAECAAHPLILVLEDLHWGDKPSIDFVDGALRHLASSPLMVVALARPEIEEVFPDLWKQRRVQALRLGELTQRACEQLAREVLGDAVSDKTIALIVERAGGNAFYLEELIRAAAEGGAELLPETVIAMLQARLEGLPKAARSVLRAASVFGGTFWRGAVRSLIEPGDRSEAVGEALVELSDREVIVASTESRFSGEEEFSFRQTLVREAAYAMLTDRDRKVGHRLAARWLERAGETNAIVMAEHHDRSGQAARSIDWYKRAAEQALAGNDLDAAVARADRAIERGASGDTLGELWLLKAEAHRWRGANGAAQTSGQSAMAALSEGSDAWCEAAGQVAAASGKLGDVDALLRAASALDALDSAEPKTVAHLVARARTAIPLLVAGHYDKLAELLAPLDGVAIDAALGDPTAIAWLARAQSFRAWVEGDVAVYLAESETSATSFLHAGDLRNACSPLIGIGIGGLEAGAFELAEDALRETLTQASRMGLLHTASVARHHLGLVRARLGDLEEARALLRDAIEASRSLVDPRLEGASRVGLARVLVMSRELHEAEGEASVAVRLLATWAPLAPYALASLAEVRLGQGRADEAQAAANEAGRALDVSTRIETGEALVRLMQAETLFMGGHLDAARLAIDKARTRLRERARKISDPALQKTFLERVADNQRTLGLAEEWAGPET